MTTAIAYFKPFAAASGSTSATAFMCSRALSGLFTTGLGTTQVQKDWRPQAGVPFGYLNNDQSKPVYINDQWLRHFRFLANHKLGGANFATLPDVANFVTRQQVDTLLTAAQDQMAQQNAQALASVIEVLGTLTSTAAIPTPALARQETTPQPIADFGETGGGGGGD